MTCFFEFELFDVLTGVLFLSTFKYSFLLSALKETPTITPNVSGLLVAEPYSWKSLVVGQPILRIRTTSTKAAALTLPPGRHVLRFTMNAPLGYHVHLCSTVPFVYGDEETVMTHLVKVG